MLNWFVFAAVVVLMLALDLGVFHKNNRKESFKEAALWSVVWISVALLFNVYVYFFCGSQCATEFFAGYIIEKSLSVDNIFVFVMIFKFFKTPQEYQRRVLFWGVLGAIFFRALMIGFGIELINHFHFVMYIFGAFLIYTGLKMLFVSDHDIDPGQHFFVTWMQKTLPISNKYHGSDFLAIVNGKRVFTLLFLVLLYVEFSDIIFAVDSIPAIFAVTRDPFIVFSSNIFAILGLRSLYFVLADMMDRFTYLKIGLGVVLSFVGVKMLLADFYPIPITISLSVILSVLVMAVLFSLLRVQKK